MIARIYEEKTRRVTAVKWNGNNFSDIRDLVPSTKLSQPDSDGEFTLLGSDGISYQMELSAYVVKCFDGEIFAIDEKSFFEKYELI